VIAVVALGRALRRAGAAADVGAAVEAVLSEDSYRGAINPECHRGTESAAGP
jgi:hypothetical protein